MKHIIKICFLLILISGTFLFTGLYICLNLLPAQNSINTLYRKSIISHYLLKNIFRLHQIGDNRFDYARKLPFPKLEITLYYKDNEELNPQTMDIVIDQLKTVIDKPEGIFVNDPVYLDNQPEGYIDTDLSQLKRKYNNNSSYFDKIARAQIFVLTKYIPKPSLSGIVTNDQDIFLFMDSIRGVSDMQPTTRYVEVSTILHEFAHLLGADHIDNNDCILAESVENVTFLNFPSNIRENYCQIDLDEINLAL